MLCRNTLIAASPAMIRDPTLGIDKAAFGRLMSWHSAGAIAGKLVTGVAADKLGGRATFLLALLLTAVSTLAFGMVSPFYLFAVLNFAGQFFKAGGWPAMAKIIGDWYPSNKYGRVWSIISTSSRVGTMAAGVLLGGLLVFVSWRYLFAVSFAITAVVLLIGWRWLKACPADVGLSPPEVESEPASPSRIERAPHPFDGTTLVQAIGMFARSGRVWLICFGMAFLTILMDFINFIPIYLSETMELEPGQATMTGSSFPAGMFAALIASSVLYDRFSKAQLVGVLGGLLLLAAGCALVLWTLPSWPLPAGLRVPVALAAIFLFGFAISPAYYVPMSVFSIAYGGIHSGFLIALIDVFGYAGALIFNYFGGSIAQDFGWPVFLAVLLSIALLAMVTMVGFLGLDYRAQRWLAA